MFYPILCTSEHDKLKNILFERKLEVLKKPTVKYRPVDNSPKIAKQVKLPFSFKMLIVRDRSVFVLASLTLFYMGSFG